MATYEPGIYKCNVISQGFDKLEYEKDGKQIVTPFFFLEVQPLGKIDPLSDGGGSLDCPDFPRSVKLWLTEKGAKGTIAILRELGWYGEKFEELEPGGSHSFSNKEVTCRVSHRQKGEKVYEDWSLAIRPKAEGGPENRPNEAKKLSAIFSSALKANALKAPTPPPVAEASTEEEDTPF